MAQTELRLRVLKNGKIVGEIWYTTKAILLKSENKIHPDSKNKFSNWLFFPFWRRIGETQWRTTKPPRADSFEVGIDIGSKWFFDGDVFDHATLCYGEREIFIGSDSITENGWFWLKKDGATINFAKDSIFVHEHIGTIHDMKVNNGTD